MIVLKIVDLCESYAKSIKAEIEQHIKEFKEKNPQHAETNVEVVESSYSKDDYSCTINLNVQNNPQLLFDLGLWIGDSYDTSINYDYMEDEDDDWGDEEDEEDIDEEW